MTVMTRTTRRTGEFPQVWGSDSQRALDNLNPYLGLRGYCTLTDHTHADVLILNADDILPDLAPHVGLVVIFTPAAVANLAANGFGPHTAGAFAHAAGIDPQQSTDQPVEATQQMSPTIWTTPDPDFAPVIDFRHGLGTAPLSASGELTVTAPAVAELSMTGPDGRPGGVTVATTITARGNRIWATTVDTSVWTPGLTALLFNGVTWAARPATAGVTPPVGATTPVSSTPARKSPGNVATTDLSSHPAWLDLKAAVEAFQELQAKDGSVPDQADHGPAETLLYRVIDAVIELSPHFPHDHAYLEALVADLRAWIGQDFGVPDFLDSLLAFQPQLNRVDGLEHLVVFPMYTQNGSPNRHLEAVLLAVVWPDFIDALQAGDYSNKLFVPVRFLDFTSGYDTNSAVLFPETVAMREVPTFTWGAIFADREAARFKTVVEAAAGATRLAMPADAARLLADPALATETFVMWDLIHDRTHMRGDLPFDPFMVKQRMPYFLYSLEELRCDLTAFREAVALEARGIGHARLVQYAILFDRIFRFAITGTRVRNYDGLGGQLLFAWLHQRGVLHWTDNRLKIDWEQVTGEVLALGQEIDDLYWRSIDRPKIVHWLAAYELISQTLSPHPASVWAHGPSALPLDGPLKGLTDAVLVDEFPLSMFYEALSKKLTDVIASTSGIRL